MFGFQEVGLYSSTFCPRISSFPSFPIVAHLAVFPQANYFHATFMARSITCRFHRKTNCDTIYRESCLCALVLVLPTLTSKFEWAAATPKSGAEDETIVMQQREKNAGKRKGFFPVVNLRMT